MAESYDCIVVGAGTAGCIMAARLSEDPGVKVLLVEAGGSDRSLFIAMPGGLPFVYQNTRIGWGHRSGPEPYLDGKTIDEKAGKVLGGSSSINAMIFNRGNPKDYEGWAKDGLPDWDYAHVLPYFRKMETFVDGPDEWRGGNGPVNVGRSEAAHPLFDAFLRSGEQAGFPITPDHNGYQQEGMHIAQTFIHDGVRQSTSRAYLRPAAKRPNLTVLTRTMVNRIIVRGGASEGIEVQERGKTRIIPCNREVIVCAGAVNTPKLLMLSGVGPAEELRRHGIKITAEAPEVGRNLQNHPGVDVQFGTAYEHSLTAELTLPKRAVIGAEWLLRRKGLGTSNFFEAGAFLRTRDDVDFPNMQYEFLPLTRRLIKGKLEPIPGFQVWMDLSRPESRGTVTLRSADPADHPLTVFNHLESRQDLQDLIDGVRLVRETLIRQPVWEKYRPVELNPGPEVVSDSGLEAFVRAHTGTSYHASGTCRMGVDDESVVDPEGRVRTVRNLRVVDASIMPKVVTANINAPVIMMAEKIADRIRGLTPLAPARATYYGEPAPTNDRVPTNGAADRRHRLTAHQPNTSVRESAGVPTKIRKRELAMADVVVIGAGAVGCAAALHLKQADPNLQVLVVEPDYTYARAATGKGTGGVRQLFTRPENIWLSQYTLDVIDDWTRWAAVDGQPAPDLNWRANGYMFVVGEQDLHSLEVNFQTQQNNGVPVEWLDAKDLADRYPELVRTDLAAGVLSTRDGWLNPTVFFSVLRAKTQAAGATFVTDRVADITQDGSVVRSVTLMSGQMILTNAVINTAGVHAPEIAAKVGMQIPVEPMRRHEHYVETGADVSHLPFVKDVHGLAVHPHRQGISVGLVDFDHPGGEEFTIDPTDYPSRVAPALAERFKGLGELTLRDSWTGLYDQNRFDGNMIMGNWPGHSDNFFVACGFSGHGFMHALGIGRGLTELVLYGQYQTLDLSRMGYQRILDDQYYGEEGVR